MNFIDRAITYLSPEWGYRRLAYRQALARGYDAADGGRQSEGWTNLNSTAEQAQSAARDVLRARARHEEDNSGMAGAIIGAFERHVIGAQLRLQSRVTLPDGSPDEVSRALVESAFKRWSKPRYCDVTGQQSLAELARMAIRRVKVDGGILFKKCYIGTGPVPFCLQAIEVDNLDTTSYFRTGAGNAVIGGIELNSYQRPVAFWLKSFTVDGYWDGTSKRIPAEQIIMLWQKLRPTQVREISQLAGTLTTIDAVKEFLNAHSFREIVAACHVFAVKNGMPTGIGRDGRATTTDPDTGYIPKKMTPGMILKLRQDQELDVVQPPNGSTSAKEFVSLQQHMAGAGVGLSYEQTSRDMSQTNYSSARYGKYEDQLAYDIDFTFIDEHFLDEVFSEFTISGVLNGTFAFPGFWENKERYLAHVFQPTGMPWGDPLKEAKANDVALASDQDTLENVCAQRGLDSDEVRAQRQRERLEALRLRAELKAAGAGLGLSDAEIAAVLGEKIITTGGNVNAE